ncbi:uncharacterized protein KY384_004614 [Bacidia gigantensis]|uniref:uncharacterized protein n=1 Tax=Bacidia gigantensis TaxID=2732470 RepID=UPI001D038828|nr:uncharacterized protein KY384_004614 [Bacidia gigantensis]KAG8531256.1 hypothetical protein KY384_004614 [Bacidia gigantensis]
MSDKQPAMLSKDFVRQLTRPFTSKMGEQYEPLYHDDEKSDSEVKVIMVPKKISSWVYPTLASLISVMLVCVGILLGLSMSFAVERYDRAHNINTADPAPIEGGYLPSAGNLHYPLIYNITYSSPPSPETNKAWDDLFPPMVGFVQHPTIAPNLSGLAVFHELHCLDILRKGFYAALSGTLTSSIEEATDHNRRLDDHHLRHCFDYLRQSFMCLADTNLEPVNFDLGGVTGWKFERTCRDFESVKRWAGENRKWDGRLEGVGEGDIIIIIEERRGARKGERRKGDQEGRPGEGRRRMTINDIGSAQS